MTVEKEIYSKPELDIVLFTPINEIMDGSTEAGGEDPLPDIDF